MNISFFIVTIVILLVIFILFKKKGDKKQPPSLPNVLSADDTWGYNIINSSQYPDKPSCTIRVYSGRAPRGAIIESYKGDVLTSTQRWGDSETIVSENLLSKILFDFTNEAGGFKRTAMFKDGVSYTLNTPITCNEFDYIELYDEFDRVGSSLLTSKFMFTMGEWKTTSYYFATLKMLNGPLD